ncbi:hypothetical protein AciX8_2667 [Granulicella mallensis MP5ACTX8]|uniref:Uncharacterized protein n=1 Tax=Granulicella mallensis (strain ATCC BAA-1857 / DSM 23137 / MP5ACTX8) TaxID=682795 RepID=G8P153_GRAMM|nr:hypothetical protein AciX8_2667 [Granulicella mallensis MP5ACTX8]
MRQLKHLNSVSEYYKLQLVVLFLVYVPPSESQGTYLLNVTTLAVGCIHFVLLSLFFMRNRDLIVPQFTLKFRQL